MSKTRVPVYGTPRQFVTVETDATIGSIVGVNLRLADGTVVTEAMLLNPPADDSDPTFTYWRLIQEIPNNIQRLALLTGDGFAYRDAVGTWRLRKVGREIVNFSFGDASPAVVYTPPVPLQVVSTRIVIKTAFNSAGATIQIGTVASPSLLMSASQSAPSMLASFETTPDVQLAAGESIRHTITLAGATVGAGQLIIDTIPLEGI